MTRRRIVARVGLPVAVLGAACALAVLGLLSLGARPGPPLRTASPAGGFSLELPGGWALRDPDPSKPAMWARAERPTRVGTPSAWLWVVRWSPTGDDALRVAADAAESDIDRLWGDAAVTRSETRFHGERAVTLRYRRPVLPLVPSVPGIRAHELRLVTIRAGQVFEIGIGGWRRLPREAGALERHVELSSPVGVRTVADASLGMRIAVPAGFNVLDPDVAEDDGVAWAARGPHDPPSGWATLWRFDTPLDDAVADSVAAASRLGTVVGRTDTVIGGRPAIRIDFEQPTVHAAPTFFTTWHFRGPDGLAWQLLVGGIEPVTTTAAMVESTFALSG